MVSSIIFYQGLKPVAPVTPFLLRKLKKQDLVIKVCLLYEFIKN
jgi:hypothetical protein